MQPIADNGERLDANFLLQSTGDTFYLIMESWGGGTPPRNPDYNGALEMLLARLGNIQAKLQSCVLDSARVQHLAPYDRLLYMADYPYPIVLSEVKDFSDLRRKIRGAQRPFGGNGGSRIRLHLSLSSPLSITALERLLVGPDGAVVQETDPWNEDPTEDPQLLEVRVRKVRSNISKNSERDHLQPPVGSPGGKQITGTARFFTRDPNVIAWVLEEANGTCEVCEKPAPFQKLNGDHFLEVHHVRTLAEGGPDTVDNTLAACPNCHRELHHGIKRESLRTSVIARIVRLVDHPPATLTADQSEEPHND